MSNTKMEDVEGVISPKYDVPDALSGLILETVIMSCGYWKGVLRVTGQARGIGGAGQSGRQLVDPSIISKQPDWPEGGVV